MRKHIKNTIGIVWKHFVAVTGTAAVITLAVTVFVNSIWNDTISAQAADTLLGIEKLRNQIADSGREYTILEVVPDKGAAEIGFLVDGYEPLLGTWDEDNNWKSWKDQLFDYATEEERESFVEEKKEELAAYYNAKYASTDKEWREDFPVYAENGVYEESDEPQDGFEQVEGAPATKTGYFSYNSNSSGKYQIAFEWIGRDNIENVDSEKKVLYYQVANDGVNDKAVNIRELDYESFPDELYVYEKRPVLGNEGSYYYVPHLWGQIKEQYQPTVIEEGDISDEDEKNELGDDIIDTDEEDGDGTGDDPEQGNDINQGDDAEQGNDANQGDDSEQGNDANQGDDSEQGNDANQGNDAEQGNDANSGQEGDSKPGDGDTTNFENQSNSVDSATDLSARISPSQGRWIRLVSENRIPDDENIDIPVDSNENDDKQTDSNGNDDKQTDSNGNDDKQTDLNGDDDLDADPSEDDKPNADLSEGDELNAITVDTYELSDGYDLYLVEFERIEGFTQGISRYAVINPNAIRESTSGYGAYDFKEVTEDDADSQYVQEYTFMGRVIYCRNTFHSNEWFKKYVLNMDESDYKDFSIRVITLTPEELNDMETLPEFDFLYLNSGLYSVSVSNGNQGGDGSNPGDGSQGGDGSDPDDGSQDGTVGDVRPYAANDNDLNAETLQYLVARTVSGALPCLVDGAILYEKEESGAIAINEALKESRIFRLAAIMCQDSLEEWYGQNSGNLEGVTVNNLLNGIVDDADKNFVTEQVYCRFHEISIICKDFYVSTIYKDGGEMEQGFQKVLDEILLDNSYRAADSSGNYNALSVDIGQADAVRHIISYQNRRRIEPKKHIKVLEIQPAKVDKPELTLEQLKAWAPGMESAEITVMTTAEFIGKIDKLNEIYDLIYIGTSEDHLNVKYWDWQTPNSNTMGNPSSSGRVSAGTVFNDSNMDGLIYYNVGDLRAAGIPLAGQLNTEYVDPGNLWGDVFAYNYVRYGGNDITKEKRDALLSFLEGSYPVIVADDFMEQPVTVFGDDNYKGPRISLSVGEYTREDLNALGVVLAQDVSSIKVKEGYKVTIFEGDNFDSDKKSTSFEESVDSLRAKTDGPWNNSDKTNNWNNHTYSIIVEKMEDKTSAKRIDGDHIDNCTYLYDFVTRALEKKYTNFYAWSEIENDSELFKFYLNRPKVSVQPTFVNGVREEGGEIYYIGPGLDGRYSLEYHFAIYNEGAASANSQYRCRLYIDINSDGKFSQEEEVSDISLTHGGGIVSADALYTDREYVLTRGVPDGYKGLLPWKIEVVQADNDNIYASMKGYTKLEGMEKEKIDVIQIKRSNDKWSWAGDPIDLEREFEDENAIYHTLLYGGVVDGVEYKGISDDYEIDVDCMTIAEYEALFDENPDCLKEYNMLILGFSDMYESFSGDSEEGPMSGIVEFINSGKSVLFAHDTTSFVNYPRWGILGHVDKTNPSSTAGAVQGTDDFSYSLNKYVRGLVGMDRYGILSNNGDILRRGQELQKGSGDYEAIVSSGKDVAYEPKSNRERTVPQVHGYTYHTINSKDRSSNGAPQKTDYTPVELDPGRSGTFSNTFRNIRYDTVYYEWGASDYGNMAVSWNGAINYMNVTQVNKGQITEYPYHLPEKFTVATTHGQYYELDFTADDDGDGQSDLVVWYCLGDRNVEGHDKTIYSESPNDVRNNYYIYNKGNVTYTGMGHSAGSSLPYTVDEAKLFINTIIAAYQAGIKHPYITILKSGLPESAELKTLYRYYDMGDGSSIALDDLATAEDSEKIYFRVQDLNFVKGSRAISTHVFYEADDGGEIITVDGRQISVNRIADNMFDAADGSPADANNLKSNGIYYILVPKSILEQCDDGLNLYFEAQTTITTNTAKQNVYVTDKVYGQLKVLKAFLFDLE